MKIFTIAGLRFVFYNIKRKQNWKPRFYWRYGLRCGYHWELGLGWMEINRPMGLVE